VTSFTQPVTHPVAARQQSSQFVSADVQGSLSVLAAVQNVWPVRLGHAIVPQLVRSAPAAASTSHARVRAGDVPARGGTPGLDVTAA
jgi:hypothetical protein